MGTRSRHPKALGFRYGPASHRFLTLVLWSLAALANSLLLIVHKEGESISTHEIRRSIMRELQVVEEEKCKVVPLRSRRNPRAVRRKGDKKPPSIVDEFLDESSAVHDTFFPEQKTAVHPNNGAFSLA
jgi:hypothetical protein